MTGERPDPNRCGGPSPDCRVGDSCAWPVLLVRRARPGRLGGWARPTADAGMATAEYAIATLAACGFAGLLVTLMRSDEVRALLYDVIRRALSLN